MVDFSVVSVSCVLESEAAVKMSIEALKFEQWKAYYWKVLPIRFYAPLSYNFEWTHQGKDVFGQT